MAYRLEPFRAEHIGLFRPQEAQSHELEGVPDESFRCIEHAGMSFTGFRGGTILGCAGYIEQWAGRAVLWSRLSFSTDRYDMVWIHRQVIDFMRKNPRRRLELTVDAGFYAGHKWAKMLGFSPEALLRSYDPTGRDHCLYARIEQ